MYHITFAPASNRAQWIGFGEVTDMDDAPVDISAFRMILQINDAQDCARLTASTQNGKIVYVDIGIFRWTLSAAEMRSLEPGTYKTGITLTNDDGTQTTQLSVGPLPVVDGVVA